MAPGELLEADLTRWANFVGTNDRLPTDERAEIDARELLGASWAKRRVRYVARRTLDGTEPAGRSSIAQSGHDRTVDRRVIRSAYYAPGGGLVRLLMDPGRSIRSRPTIPPSRILPFLAAFVLVFSACASSGGPETESAPTAKVAELGGVSDLRERFNEDPGKVRLILLISPT